MNKREKIIAPALEKMQELTAFTGIWSKDGKSLQVRSTPDELKVSFPVIAYPTLFQSGLASLMIEKNKEPRLVVIAGKISPELRSQLRELEIGYLDAAGNIFLKASRFFVLVDGQKDYPPSTKEKRQLFSKSGILIIFHLLTSPEIAGRTYRDLAETLDISLGSVAQTGYFGHGDPHFGMLTPWRRKRVKATKSPDKITIFCAKSLL